MNQVSGKVLLKETSVGIPDLLVEIYDVDVDIRIGESGRPGDPSGAVISPAIAIHAAAGSLPGNRLISGLTAADGSFRLEYEDADFRRGNPDEQRPDLLLVVRAPEEMDRPNDERILHVSADIRRSAGVVEAYIISIPTEKLAAVGLSAPTKLDFDEDEPEAVIQKLSRSVSHQVKIKQAVQKIATEQVAAERKRTAQIESEVEKRLLEKLTGIPDRLAERLNYVPPGANVEAAMYQTLNKSIEGSINQNPPAKGYIVLTQEQAEQFKNPDGGFRDDIPAEEMTPFLFGSADDSQRHSFLVREDPGTGLPSSQPPLELLEPDSPEDGTGGTPRISAIAADGEPGSDGAETIPGFVDRLISTMTSPEEAIAVGLPPRATQEDVDAQIGSFELHTGPADVPAFYDFHSLEIAFDYVWQKAIDEGVLESAKVLSRQLLDMGGDPIGAMKSGDDPIKALRNELRIVQSAHADSNLARMLGPTNQGSLRARSMDEDGLPSGPHPDQDIPRPPKTGGGAHTTTPPDAVLDQVREPFPHELLNQIESLLHERFAFDVFAPGSVNFGILVTYRQRWAPINYQVGDLIKTLTLTPKETRKVTAKRVVKKDRSVKEMENSLRIRKDDSSNTARDEAEIIAKAEAKTNFSLTAQGTYNIGIAKGDSTTVFGKDAASSSSDIKKAFREAVIKAAQEYKDERKLEVETKETYEEELTESAEISNPNEEIPVTFLFYELQRHFHVSEHIHRLMPVVLVAMDVPNPGRRSIDALLLTYGWIIDRVLLDDQFRRPLEYFRIKLVGEEFALKTMAQNLAVMRGVVDELKKSYTQSRSISNQTADLLTAETVRRAQAVAEGDSEGFFEKGAEAIFGDGGGESIEAYRIFEDVARERHERAINKEKELRAQLDSETAALKAASDTYSSALAEHLNCLMDIGTLRLHIKENILYYMQAIWSHTFKDHIFLELHKKKVPRLAPREQSYGLSEPGQPPSSVPAKAGEVVLEVEARVQFESGLDPEEDFVTLAEVADLDNLLGFKGNYMIFPLRQSNALTDFMMTPFVDSELGLRDPDEFGNFTPQEFVAYARGLIAQMEGQVENGEITQEELQAAIDRLSDQFRRLLSAPRRAEDDIVIPTGSLYIEALPGAHPILEDFKLKHRVVDVKKVQAEVRRLELENMRYAARILEGEREDPDIERKVVVSGNGDTIIVPPVEN